MKRLSFLLVFTLFLALILSACSPAPAPAATPVSEAAAPPATALAPLPQPTVTLEPMPEPTDEPIILSDGLGRTVTLPAPAQRIVSMAPSNTEILFAVGAGGQVVGRDDFSNYPPEALAVSTIGGSMGDYNLEQIVSLNPDLVLAAEINTPEQVKAMEDLGLTVFYLSNPTDMEGLYAMLDTVGELSGHKTQAETLAASLSERVAVVEATLSAMEKPVTVFYELDGTEPAKPWTVGPGNFIDLLIRMAGGENIGASLEFAWGQLSLEALLVADPEVILLGDANYGVTVEQVAGRAGWGDLSAVREGRVFPFDGDLVSRPGPRMVEGLEEMARIFHPDLFK